MSNVQDSDIEITADEKGIFFTAYYYCDILKRGFIGVGTTAQQATNFCIDAVYKRIEIECPDIHGKVMAVRTLAVGQPVNDVQ